MSHENTDLVEPYTASDLERVRRWAEDSYRPDHKDDATMARHQWAVHDLRLLATIDRLREALLAIAEHDEAAHRGPGFAACRARLALRGER